MNAKRASVRRFWMGMRSATAAGLLATAAGGCDLVADAEKTFVGSTCEPGPAVYLVVDRSESTAALRKPGGLYAQAITRTINETASACGVLFAAPATGNSIGEGRWLIDGEEFLQSFGNEERSGEVRGKIAERALRPKARLLLVTDRNQTPGSDHLGIMRRVVAAAGSGALTAGREKVIVMLFDGALNVTGAGRLSVYDQPLVTRDQRERFIAKLRESSEIPDLSGVRVFAVGLGLGLERGVAEGVLALWPDLIKNESGGEFVNADSPRELTLEPTR